MSIQEEIAQIKTQLAQSKYKRQEGELIIKLLKLLTLLNSPDTKPAIDRLQELAVRTGSARYEAWGLVHLARHSRLRGEYDASLGFAKQAMAKFKELKDQEGLASAYNIIGFFYQNKGDNPKAMKAHLQELQIGKKIGDEQVIAQAHNNIGMVHFLQNKYEDALEVWLQAVEIGEKTGHKQALAQSYNNIAMVRQNQRNFPESIKNHLVALKLRKEIGDKRGIAASYNNIGIIYNDQNNSDEALKYHFLSLKIKEEIDDKTGLAASYNNIGAIQQSMGNYPEALKNFTRALHIMEEIGGKKWICTLYHNVAVIHQHQGNFLEALQNILHALRIREEIGDKFGIALSYNFIGNIYERTGNYAEALKNNLASLQLREEMDDKYGIATSCNDIGGIYKHEQNYPVALQNYLRALEIRKQIGDKRGTAESYNSVGSIYESEGNYNEALANHLQALDIYQTIGNKHGLAICYMRMGEVYEKKEAHAEALKNKLLAFNLADEIGSKDLIRQFSLSLSNTYKANGDFENALKYHEIYHSAENETLGEKTQKQLNILSFQHNMEQKEKETELNRLRYLELEDKNRQIQHEKEEAERQRRRAEQSEHFKQMFLANMSHEIRTPMNAIAGMTNILLSNEQSKENLQYLNAIKHSSDNLLVVINDVLDISKIEAGKLNIENTPFNLKQQLEMLRNIFEIKAKEKKLSFAIDIAPKVPEMLIGDPYRLNQVLINLLGNAFKFTQKGKITLSVSHGGKNQYQFSVTDTGIGIAPDKLALIFESFSQAESDTTRQYGGTGLGLTISKQLVELMGGKIEVTSKTGKGSTFKFALRLNAASKADLPVSTREKFRSTAKDLAGLRILLAEDNEYNQIVSVEIIKKLIDKPQITIAETGKEVLQHLKAKAFDIVLMDLHMPVMDGYEATKKIRKTFPESKKHIPILAVTASVVKADIDRCLKDGMNGYLSKPFTPGQLLEEISRQVGKKPKASVLKQKAVKVEKPSKKNGIDTSYLETITEGNTEEMIEYIDIFMKFAPVQMQKIEEAVKSSDKKALYSALHTIKPQLQFMGVQNALQKTLQLETEVREKEKVNTKMKEEAGYINLEIKEAMKHWALIKKKLNSK